VYFNDSVTDDDATNIKSVLMNGTVEGKIAVSCNVGAIRISNATICSYGGTSLQLTNGQALSFAKGLANDGNIIENSSLYSGNFTGPRFNSSNADFSAVEFTIKNSDLATAHDSEALLSNTGVAKSGTFKLGKGVNFYTKGASFVKATDPAPTVIGETAVKAEGTHSITIAGNEVTGANKWSTPAYVEADVTVEASQGGTVTLPAAKLECGTEVTVTATPDTGFVFSHLLVNGEKVEGLTFTVPEETAVTVEYVFLKEGTVATVVTGDTTVYAMDLAELLGAIDATGNSVVTLYQDITNDALIAVPYTCTLDLNGHKISTTASNAWDVKVAGTENKVITIKNGTIDGAMAAVCWRNGALVVDNCTLIGRGSAAIQILNHKNADANAAAYNEQNIIKNSTVWSPGWVTLSFNNTGGDFTAVSLKIENSDLIAKDENPILSNQGKQTKPGTYVLGNNVKMYTKGAAAVKTSDPKPTVVGTVRQMEGTYSITVGGTTLEGLNCFTAGGSNFTKEAATNGTYVLSPANPVPGETVTIIATGDEGFVYDYAEVNGVPIPGSTFTMAAGDVIEVFFKAGQAPAPADVKRPANHMITVDTVTGGTVKASAEKATINTVIKLEVVAEAGYVLESITVKKLYNGTTAELSSSNTFFMPYSNVVITPVFKQAG